METGESPGEEELVQSVDRIVGSGLGYWWACGEDGFGNV